LTTRQYNKIIKHLNWIKNVKEISKMDCANYNCSYCTLFYQEKCLFTIVDELSKNMDSSTMRFPHR
jgi:hypothetical protein